MAAARGVRGLKLRALCQEAGVSPGTFTAHFRNLQNFSEELLPGIAATTLTMAYALLRR